MISLPLRDEVSVIANERLVAEYYSR